MSSESGVRLINRGGGRKGHTFSVGRGEPLSFPSFSLFFGVSLFLFSLSAVTVSVSLTLSNRQSRLYLYLSSSNKHIHLTLVTTHNPFTKMTSFIGVSSIYQTPTLELYRRTTPATAPTNDNNKSLLHFNYVLKAYYSTNTNQTHKPHHSLSLVPSAIATPNSSVLSEEAFKGLGALDGYYDDDDDDNNNSSGAATSTSPEDDHELAVSELGLPQRLVQSLHTRGITHLFPIQVFYPLSLSLNIFFFLGSPFLILWLIGKLNSLNILFLFLFFIFWFPVLLIISPY